MTQHIHLSDARRRQLLRVAAILFLQIALLVFVSGRKQEFHIDEIYSYVISNSYDTDRVSNAENLWETWASGEEYRALTTVQPGEQFAYGTVYRNTSTDCHPPLYYWMLHTLCSFFPNQFSKWFGLGLNIGLFVIAGFVIFLLSEELFATDRMKLLPLILYGFSPFAVETVTFIRMYMLLTLLAAAFTLFNVRMLKHGFTRKRLIASWATIFLGAMTQYYAILFCFWGVLFFELILLKRRDYKHFLLYGIGAMASVGLMLLIFPYAIAQATGTATNNVGNEVVRNLFNVRLWVQMTISLVKSFATTISYHPPISRLLFLVSAVLLACFAAHTVVARKDTPCRTETLWMLTTVVFTILSISFVGGEYVYLRYIYSVVPLIYVLSLFALDTLLSGCELLKRVLVCLLVLFSVGNAALGAVLDKSPYLYKKTYADDALLSSYRQYPCFLDVGRTRWPSVPTGNLIKLSAFESVYMATSEDLLTSNIITDCMNENDSCIVFVCTDTYWVEGMEADDFFRRALPEGCRYTFLCNGHHGQYFLVTRN